MHDDGVWDSIFCFILLFCKVGLCIFFTWVFTISLSRAELYGIGIGCAGFAFLFPFLFNMGLCRYIASLLSPLGHGMQLIVLPKRTRII